MEAIKNLNLEKIVKLTLISIIGSILITVSAKIKIPFYPVPMTMQTFTILLIGISLGSKIGLATVMLYLLEGIIGLPVFANSPEKGIGLMYFVGPTMGYLFGFLIAVYFAGMFKYDKKIITNFFKLIFSISFIYILGVVWLGILIGWENLYLNLVFNLFYWQNYLKYCYLHF